MDRNVGKDRQVAVPVVAGMGMISASGLSSKWRLDKNSPMSTPWMNLGLASTTHTQSLANTRTFFQSTVVLFAIPLVQPPCM